MMQSNHNAHARVRNRASPLNARHEPSQSADAIHQAHLWLLSHLLICKSQAWGYLMLKLSNVHALFH